MRLIIIFIMLVYSQALLGQSYLFEENKGQWNSEVLFRTEIPGGFMFITKHGMKYLYFHPDDLRSANDHLHDSGSTSAGARIDTKEKTIRMQAVAADFINISSSFELEKNGPTAAYSNYFLGKDPKKWVTGVKKYKEVLLKNIYPGIDVRFYHENETLKYDLLVAAKADPSQVAIRYLGASKVAVANNELHVSTAFGTTLELRPLSFQIKKNIKQKVPCHYLLKENILSFEFPEKYDNRTPLVIDPTLIFSTYSGSVADNWGYTATFDEDGNLYSGGIVRATGFPVTNGALQEDFAGTWDVALLKFDSAGTQLKYATYFGGGATDIPHSLIVDNNGDLLVFGTTSSPDFPVTSNAYQKTFLGGVPMDNDTDNPTSNDDVPVGGVPYVNGSDLYIAKISGDGKKLISSTYLGGSGNDGIMLRYQALTKNYGDSFRGEIITDKNDNIYVASYTQSDDFPIVNGFQSSYGGGDDDGLIAKLSPDLSQLLWSSYLGGSEMDGLFSIKLDTRNNVIVGGGTDSDDFPVTPGVYKESKVSVSDIDGTIAVIKNDGSELLKSTLLGTSSYDQVYFIDVDTLGNVYALGQTQGDYPVSAGVYSDPGSGQFIHKLNKDLDSTYFSTVFGSGSGSPDIRPTAFLVNECENLLISGWGGNVNHRSGYVGGYTYNLPVTENAFQKTTDGSDFYLMVLLQDAKQLLYASYIGENGGVGDHVDGGTSRFDKRGIVYQSVCASCGGTNNFPTTTGAWSSTNESLYPERNCNNAVLKFDLSQLIARLATNTPKFDNPGITSGCTPLDIMFLNKSVGGIDFFWTFGNGLTSSKKDSIPVTYEKPGVYKVSLKATDIATCVREDFDYGTIYVYSQNFDIMEPQKICYGSQIELNAEGGVAYEWQPSAYLNKPNTKNPLAKPDTTTYFKVKITNEHGCSREDSVLITVVPDFNVGFSFMKENSCFDTPNIYFKNNSRGADSFTWNFGNGSFSEDDSLVYNYHKTDTFSVQLEGRLDICAKRFTEDIPSVKTFIPNIITPNDDGKNDFFKVITAEPVDIKVFNRWGESIFEKEEYNNDFNGEGFAAGVYYYEVKFREDGTSCIGWLQILK